MRRVNLSLAEFEKLSRQEKVIPLALTVEGDLETPINLFLKLCTLPNSYLLESVTGGEKWGRYSYIGRHPVAVITAKGDTVTIQERDGHSKQQGDVLEIIQRYLTQYEAIRLNDLPDFTGGAIGQISYDHIAGSSGGSQAVELPEIHLLVNDQVIAYDHLKQEIVLIVNVKPYGNLQASYQQALSRLQELRQEILSPTNNHLPRAEAASPDTDTIFSNETKASFMDKVARAKEYIKSEQVAQVVLSQQLVVETRIDPFAAYRKLRSINPSPYLFYINYGDYQIVGSSPELLVKVKDNKVETCPIAGTRPRGNTAEQDQAYAEELLVDEKELAEHLMLLALGKADLEKISRPDSVITTKYLTVEKYSHVMHMVSHLVGELQEGCNMYDAIRACLPAGTVSGSPKNRAMEIIAELESQSRGIYAGAIGYLGFNGNLDLCITIRTLVFQQGKAYVQAGAGIVADSEPAKEYQETLMKAKALLLAVTS